MFFFLNWQILINNNPYFLNWFSYILVWKWFLVNGKCLFVSLRNDLSEQAIIVAVKYSFFVGRV